jgi:hypothetical protein
MKMPLAVDFYRAFSFLARPLKLRISGEHSRDEGNRSFPATLVRQSRLVSVPSVWDPARLNGSNLPSSLEDWLASKEALVIR